MIFVTLDKGQIVLTNASDVAASFDPADIDGMADHMGPDAAGVDWMTSSSVNHPKEYGLDDDFEIDVVLQKIRDRIIDRRAIVVPGGPATGAAKRLEELTADATYPLLLKFQTLDKKGESVLLRYPTEGELRGFLNGIRYSERLRELEPPSETIEMRLGAKVTEITEGMRARPSMFGDAAQNDAQHWLLMHIVGLLAGYTSEETAKAARIAQEKVANRHGWPGPRPLSTNVTTVEEMAVLIVEVRAEFEKQLHELRA